VRQHKIPFTRNVFLKSKIPTRRNQRRITSHATHAACLGTQLDITGADKTIGVLVLQQRLSHLPPFLRLLPSQVGLHRFVISGVVS
jgi:hypothetical protein